ncbi:MAG TPA: type II toxin-antitoxin system antitoxin SocA domain-containing protein [Stellaceae bacterium]|jgi:uncharacterized phage-associated protein|nr:type II toxin-antitoxin system antitoxin SocA domain-containing protein [Stellaceae bacterium]
MSIAAIDAARRVCELSGWTVPNLQLQKILYITHMIYAGRHNGDRLIRESFEAWDYGPVIPSLYRKVRIFGSKPVQDIFAFAKPSLPPGIDAVVKEGCDYLLTKSHAQLVAMTHRDDGAWSKNYTPNMMGRIIQQEDILEEYKTQIAAT